MNLENLTPKQKRKIEKLAKVVEAGDLATLEHLFEIEEEFENKVLEVKQEFENKVAEVKDEFEKKAGEVKDSVPNLVKVLEDVKGKDGDKGDQGEQGELGPEGKPGKDGKDGKDGVDGVDGKDADETLIVEKIEKDLPKLGESIRDGLELLQGEDRLDAKAIKNLPEATKEIVRAVGGGARGIQLYVDDTKKGIAQMLNLKAGDNITLTHAPANGLNTITIAATGGGTVGPGTANEIAYFDTTESIASLAVATYPSLTELSYIKGVTSAIQTQIDAKGDVTGPSSSVDNALVRFDGTGGKTVQGYTSGAPTVSDTGVLTFGNDFGFTNFSDQLRVIKLLGTGTGIFVGPFTRVQNTVGNSIWTWAAPTSGTYYIQKNEVDARFIVPDNRDNAWVFGEGISDGINIDTPYITIRTTNSSEAVSFGKNVGIGTTTPRGALEIATAATNDDPNISFRQARVATTDATVTTLQTIAIAASTTYLLEARVAARRTGGTAGTADDGAVYIRRAMVTTKAGTVTINTVQDDLTQEDQAGWDCTFTVSGTDVLLRVTGAVDNSIVWHTTTLVQLLST